MLSVTRVPREVERLCGGVGCDDEKMISLPGLVVKGALSCLGLWPGASEESCGYRRRVASQRIVGGCCMAIVILTVGDKTAV